MRHEPPRWGSRRSEGRVTAQGDPSFAHTLGHYDPRRPSLAEASGLGGTPLAELPEAALRPPPEALARVLDRY